jgi:hypothetical protein
VDFDCRAEKSKQPTAQNRLRERAIWEGGIVGQINEIGVGPRRRNLTIDGQAAEARVKDQNRRT